MARILESAPAAISTPDLLESAGCKRGSRCEKAALRMAEPGVVNVQQPDGGLLKYFGVTGAAHFDVHCNVFDQRELVDAALSPF